MVGEVFFLGGDTFFLFGEFFFLGGEGLRLGVDRLGTGGGLGRIARFLAATVRLINWSTIRTFVVAILLISSL